MANTLKDGEVAYIQGSGKKPYELKNTGGVFSCSCPAWRNQSATIDMRTCKHLKKHLGDKHEADRLKRLSPDNSVEDENGETAADKTFGKDLLAFVNSQAPQKKVKGKTMAEATGYDVQDILDRAAKNGRKLRPDEKAKINGAPVLLAHKFENDIDPTGWWWSEKLDGVRAYWDGEKFITRQGNVYHAPDWFTAAFPKHALDGELWIGRGKFQQTISVVKRLDGGLQWENVRYMVYDAPHLELPFEERMKFLESNKLFMKGVGGSYATLLSQQKVQSKQHLVELLKRHVEDGAEGIMIRQPGSLYEVGRSYTLLKVKLVEDAEAEVIGYNPGKGRHKGVVGSLQVRMSNGKEFDLGTGLEDAERRDPPPIGSTVTFTYIGLTDDGKPKCAAFVCTRDYE
jgi:DNA ligase-1